MTTTKTNPLLTNTKPNSHDPTLHTKKSNLIHSAKVVADAAQAHPRAEPDKAEVASAADLINASAEYEKLDDNTWIGKYVDKAEVAGFRIVRSGGFCSWQRDLWGCSTSRASMKKKNDEKGEEKKTIQ